MSTASILIYGAIGCALGAGGTKLLFWAYARRNPEARFRSLQRHYVAHPPGIAREEPVAGGASLTCPDCGGTWFSDGPRGGCSVNIQCVSCGGWWNWTAILNNRMDPIRRGGKT